MDSLKEVKCGQGVIRIVKGDITSRPVDAIVNAANSFLQHGGGVAGAIVRKGGEVIQKESDRIGFTPVGSAVMTTAGALPASHVIHAVGPRMGEGNEDAKLLSAVRSVFELADREGLGSVSLPAISSGIFGFPKERCSMILTSAARDFLIENTGSSLRLIEFCLFDDETAELFVKMLDKIDLT